VNPFFFGTKARRLFGAYDPPRGAGRRGAVICYPWSREYLLAHATIRQLARALSAAGFHALRFDYYGTGDSGGDETEAGQEQWLADVATAVDELKEVSQLAHVGLIGLRYGATLAAGAAAHRGDIDRLVLWEPVVDGRAYLNELGVSPMAPRASGDMDVNGAVVSARLRQEMETITLASFGRGLPRTLILDSAGVADAHEPLRARLADNGVDCVLGNEPDVRVWNKAWGGRGEDAGMAIAAVNRIVEWLA
jgi:alpha/beta superfamily hydrolase